MKIRSVLCAGMLASLTTMSFALGGVYTTVSSLDGNAVVGQEAAFKVKYRWFTDQERSGKVFYTVAGTNCNGSADIDRHSGLLPIFGELDIKCTFDKSAIFATDTVLQLYDGDTKKEVSEHQGGTITVTNA